MPVAPLAPRALPSFSVDDVGAAHRFYGEVLGLEVRDGGMHTLRLVLPGGGEVLVYPKGPAHAPASFTVLNLLVPDVDAAVDELNARGVVTTIYGESDGVHVDARGVQRGRGPDIAWFTDPAGNVLAVLQDV